MRKIKMNELMYLLVLASDFVAGKKNLGEKTWKIVFIYKLINSYQFVLLKLKL